MSYHLIFNSCQQDSFDNDTQSIEKIYAIKHLIEYLHCSGKLYKITHVKKCTRAYNPQNKPLYFALFDGYKIEKVLKDTITDLGIYFSEVDNDKIDVSTPNTTVENLGIIQNIIVGVSGKNEANENYIKMLHGDIYILSDMLLDEKVSNSVDPKKSPMKKQTIFKLPSFRLFPDFVASFIAYPKWILNDNPVNFAVNVSLWKSQLCFYQSNCKSSKKEHLQYVDEEKLFPDHLNKYTDLTKKDAIDLYLKKGRNEAVSYSLGMKTKPPLFNPYLLVSDNNNNNPNYIFKYIGPNHLRVYKLILKNNKYVYVIDYSTLLQQPHEIYYNGYLGGYLPHPYNTKTSWYEFVYYVFHENDDTHVLNIVYDDNNDVVSFTIVHSTTLQVDLNTGILPFINWGILYSFLNQIELNSLEKSIRILSPALCDVAEIGQIFTKESVKILGEYDITDISQLIKFMKFKYDNNDLIVKEQKKGRYLLQSILHDMFTNSWNATNRISLLLKTKLEVLKFELNKDFIKNSIIFIEDPADDPELTGGDDDDDDDDSDKKNKNKEQSTSDDKDEEEEDGNTPPKIVVNNILLIKNGEDDSDQYTADEEENQEEIEFRKGNNYVPFPNY